MYCLELLQLVSIIVSLIYVILPLVMMGHVSTVCSARIKMTFGTKVTSTIWSLWRSMKTFWNRKEWPFPLFFWGSLRILPRYDLKALILLEEEVKNSNTMYVFCTWCSTKWKNWFRIKGAHLAPLPKKASRTVQTDNESWKDLPVRPNSNPHYPLPLAPYIRIYRNPESY